MRFRFGLRTVALLVAVICIALWSIPVVMEWYKWRLIRGVVDDTLDKVAASPGKPTVYTGVVWHSQYCLANVEVKWDPVTDSGTHMSSIPRNDAVFAIIRRNIAFSISYNLIGATLAVTGTITPLVAAVLMPLSSLTVVLASWSSTSFSRERES